LVQSHGGHVGLVGWRHDDLRRRLDAASDTARVFAQAGASSIYDDVVYEGQSIEMERLWLWVARNIPYRRRIARR
jgi:hypothetical protein